MIKKILLGFLAIFVAVFAICNVGYAASKKYTKGYDVPKWKKSQISVYIPAKDEYVPLVRKGFQKWQDVSCGNLKFNYVEKQPADIEVNFVKQKGTDTELGSYSVQIINNEIKKAYISLSTKSPEISKYSKSYVELTILHEIGHVLGLSDAPRKNFSIMHKPISEDQKILKTDILNLFRVNSWNYMNRDR